MTKAINLNPMKTMIERPMDIKDAAPAQKKFYEDQYAMVSFVESIPCIKVRLSGVPQSSDHYQFVNEKLLECISSEISNYCRLHLLTDSTKAGLVLDEDIAYYKMNVIPAMEKAGIRYHAIVLPESLFGRLFIDQVSLSTKKLRVEYFNTIGGASKWLKNR
jgi:hypothetical protein